MTISRLRFSTLIAGFLMALSVAGVQAVSLPTVRPEAVGLSTERLARLDRVMQRHVDENKLAGVVTLIARRGKIAHISAMGKMDLETGMEMNRDSIFRLYSMTKPITSVALLMLFHDVQAYLVERLSGMPFDVYLREKIFEPLGMQDTAFGLPQEKLNRFTTYYESTTLKDQIVSFDPLVPGIQPIDKPETSEYLKGADYPGGGSGLVSTAEDYFRFSQMLLNGGVYNGVRLLSPKTVALMTMDHVPAEADRSQLPPGYGFGLGVAVLQDLTAQGNLGSVGQYGWYGIATTRVLIDPKEEMIMILLTQYAPMNFSLTSQFETLAYQAIID